MMVGLTSLWLPILLSAVVVFIASSIIHMVLPWHKGDYPPLPNEDRAMDAIRQLNLAPGDYFFPRPASQADMRTEAFKAKMAKGPMGILTIMRPGGSGMGKSLGQWFVFSIVVSIFAGYVASRAVQTGAPYLSVFRFAGVTAFMGYAFAYWPQSIWYGKSWMSTAKMTIDGLIYGLLTAGVFGWLWPR